MTERPTPVLYLDLDGTVRHGFDELGRFVNSPGDVVVFPQAVEMMQRWKAGGGRIIGVSNQGGIALGHLTMQDCAATMLRTHELAEGLFDTIVWCTAAHRSVELAHGTQGMFVLSSTEANRYVSFSEEDQGWAAPLVPSLRYFLCARAARSTAKEARSQTVVSGADIPAAYGSCAAGLLSRDFGWRRNPRRILEAEQGNPCIPSGCDYDGRTCDQVAGTIWGDGVQITSSGVVTRKYEQTAVAMEVMRDGECSIIAESSAALSDCQTEQGKRSSTHYRESSWYFDWIKSFKIDGVKTACCWCRKPSPGLLIEGALYTALDYKGEIYPPHMALMVGDRPEDEECARIASVDFQWASEWRAQA